MTKHPDPAVWLWDAKSAAEKILRFTAGQSRQNYFSNELLRSAVERQMIIIGEALALLRRDFPVLAGRIPDINRIIGMRHILVQAEIPGLRDRLAKLLGTFPGGG